MHRHRWLDFVKDARGTYAKRDCPGGTVEFKGRVIVCRCSDCQHPLLFIPADTRLQSVECDLVL